MGIEINPESMFAITLSSIRPLKSNLKTNSSNSNSRCIDGIIQVYEYLPIYHPFDAGLAI